MGLKTTNYEVKGMREILPTAYAYIRDIKISGDHGCATIAVCKSRELAADSSIRPYEEVEVDFEVDRTVNDRETVYKKVKGTKLIDRWNREKQTYEKVEIPEKFHGWEDDIV